MTRFFKKYWDLLFSNRFVLFLGGHYWRLFIFIGILFGSFVHWKKEHKIVFIIPFYHVGGAERVHAEIVQCLKNKPRLVVFTQKSKNNKFFNLFECDADILDLTRYRIVNGLYWYILIYFYLGMLASKINQFPGTIVFGSNTQFFYKMLPYLDEKIRIIDLSHAYGGDIESVSIDFCEYIHQRVAIAQKTYDDIIRQYRGNKKPRYLEERISIIQNGIVIPDEYTQKNPVVPLEILYVGRNSPEKRVFLVGNIARKCFEQGIPCRFSLVGGVVEGLDQSDLPYVSCHDEVESYEELSEYYKKAHILLITSKYEGFPMSIMEAMSYGVVPISTQVGGIPEHVITGMNGVLVEEISEEQIINAFTNKIAILSKDENLFLQLSQNAYSYSKNHFSIETFCKKYQHLFEDQYQGPPG